MIEIAELKGWLGNPAGKGVTALLTALEARAVDILEAETGRHFGTSATLTEYLVGTGSNRLVLREAPASVTSVHYRAYVGDDWTEILEADSDGFELRAPKTAAGKARLLRKGGVGWPSAYEYRVIYDFGYAAGAEPPEIRQAVMDLVALKYNERGREGLQSLSAGGVSWTVLTNIGKRHLLQVPGLDRIVDRWRGVKAA